MTGWIGIREARERPGLRVVLLRGFPSPWSQAARAIFELKGIPFAKVHRSRDDPPGALLEWTRQESFPVAVYECERPRSGWAEILLLAERLAPEPALVPADAFDRALMFGLAHEILGEMGLAWCRRLVGLAPHVARRAGDPEVEAYLYRYGSGPAASAAAAGRIESVLNLLTARLRRQRDLEREFLVGASLTAVDLYWAVTSNLFSPLPPEILPLDPQARKTLCTEAEPLLGALHGTLLEHRDLVHRRFLRCPVDL